MLNGKQKRYLRGLASTENAVVQIGKYGFGESVMKTLEEALQARELVKIKVLKNSGEDAHEIAVEVCELVGAELVQIIGKNIVIYRANKDEPKIVLPQ